MEVVKITPRGYCHGVVDAIKIARRLGAEAGSEAVPQPVRMLGYLVHNEHVTDELKEHAEPLDWAEIGIAVMLGGSALVTFVLAMLVVIRHPVA